MSIFSKLFSSGKKDATYTGPKPYTSLHDIGGANDYYNMIKGRSNGIGVGYSPDYVEKASNPVIARMRSNFNAYDIPELTSELSRTGRRRGSAGFDQIRRAYQEQGLNEEAAYAPIYAASEEARRADINSNTAAVNDWLLNEAAQRNTIADFENTQNNNQVAREDQRTQREAAGYQRLLQAATDLASPYVSAITSRMPSFGGQNFYQANASAPPKGYDYKNIKTALGRVR